MALRGFFKEIVIVVISQLELSNVVFDVEKIGGKKYSRAAIIRMAQ